MKVIELRRHSIKTGHGDCDLSEEGIALAREVGATQLRGKNFTALFVSTLQRTSETLSAFAEGAGDFPTVAVEIFSPSKEVFLSEDAMALWDGACHRAEKLGQDMVRAALTDDPSRARRVAQAAAESFRRWVVSLPEETHALVINHSPALELIVFGLFGTAIPQLQPTEGLVLVDQNGELQQQVTQNP